MVEYRPTSPWTVDRGRVAQLVSSGLKIRVSRVQVLRPPFGMQKRSFRGRFLRARLLSSGHARMLHVKHPCGLPDRAQAAPRANYLKKRLYCNPRYSTRNKEARRRRDHIRLPCAYARVLLSAVLACALLIPVTTEEAHASDQPRIVKVGYTDSEGLLAKTMTAPMKATPTTTSCASPVHRLVVRVRGSRGRQCKRTRFAAFRDAGQRRWTSKEACRTAPPLPDVRIPRKQLRLGPHRPVRSEHTCHRLENQSVHSKRELRVAILAT